MFLPVVTDLPVGGLDVPAVTQLLRGMFNGYFVAMSLTGSVAAFGIAGRPGFAVAAIAAAAFAIVARRWFLPRLDAELQMRDSGNTTAVRRLRALHLLGMLVNAIQLVAVVASVPLVV